MLICAIWNSLSVPVAIAFSPSWSQTPEYVILDNAINALFFIDVIIAFNTIFVNFDGEEVTDRMKIASKYLRGSFFVDIVSSFPFDLILEELSVLGLLKVVRIARLTRIINKASVEVETKAVSRNRHLLTHYLVHQNSQAGVQLIPLHAHNRLRVVLYRDGRAGLGPAP